MSWLGQWAGKAENFLNFVDQAAGEALQADIPDNTHPDLNWDEANYDSVVRVPRYVSPQQLYSNQGSFPKPTTLQVQSTPQSGVAYSYSVPSNLWKTNTGVSTASSNKIPSQEPKAFQHIRTITDSNTSSPKHNDVELLEYLNSPSASSAPTSKAVNLSKTGHYLGHSVESIRQDTSVSNGIGGDEKSEFPSHISVDNAVISTPPEMSNAHSDLDLKNENNILRNEVASLKEELNSVFTSNRQLQAELSDVRRKLAGLEQRGSRGSSAELAARLEDVQEALRSKDSQLAVLRVRLEESDRELQMIRSKRSNEPMSPTSSSVLRQNDNEVNTINLKARLAETEMLLDHERQAHKQLQDETMERINCLEMEKQRISCDLASAVRQAHDDKNKCTELTAQLKVTRGMSDSARQELTDYKDKAMRILQSKERLISSMRDNSASKSTDISGAGSLSAAELDSVRQERDMLREELHQTRLTLETSRLELTELETHLQHEQDNGDERLREISEQLSEERTKCAELEQELSRQKHEHNKVKQDLTKQVGAVKSRLDDRDSEISRLRSQLTMKKVCSHSSEELESRILQLTESLIQKQTSLETLSTERNSLLLQLERLEKQCKEAEAETMRITSSTVHVTADHNDVKHRSSVFLNDSPSDNQVTRQVKTAANGLDRLSMRVGLFLRRYPLARIVALLYVILLHFWLMFMVMTYRQEIHPSGDHQPIPPHPPNP